MKTTTIFKTGGLLITSAIVVAMAAQGLRALTAEERGLEIAIEASATSPPTSS